MSSIRGDWSIIRVILQFFFTCFVRRQRRLEWRRAKESWFKHRDKTKWQRRKLYETMRNMQCVKTECCLSTIGFYTVMNARSLTFTTAKTAPRMPNKDESQENQTNSFESIHSKAINRNFLLFYALKLVYTLNWGKKTNEKKRKK